MKYTSDFDKRDLLTIFGLDKKVQIKDTFFHNANSALEKKFGKDFLLMKKQQILRIEYGVKKSSQKDLK